MRDSTQIQPVSYQVHEPAPTPRRRVAVIRSNFADIEEILLYLQQTGEASLDQIQAACLGGIKSRVHIQTYLQRLTRSSPPRVKSHMILLDPASPVMTAIYRPCADVPQAPPIEPSCPTARN